MFDKKVGLEVGLGLGLRLEFGKGWRLFRASIL